MLFYKHGALAVDFFFLLSGFIFFWLYSVKIISRKISFFKFIFLRISRLYPLHILTLLLVFIEQIISNYNNGTYIICQNNDLKHFILNIFLIQNWSETSGFSFNTPAWSISVEFFLYIIFFFFGYISKQYIYIISTLTILFTIFYYNVFSVMVNKGLMSFFIGGITFLIYTKLKKYNLKMILNMFLILFSICWFYVFYDLYIGVYFTESTSLYIKNVTFLKVIYAYKNEFVLFPITLLTFIFVESSQVKLFKKISYLGDVSFSMYLIHFPIQMICIMIFNKTIFSEIYFFLLYFFVLILLSKIIHHKYEIPARQFLRRKIIDPIL
jgi:peptidoglycan/LPS O-acetylase OafA/YrhL